MIVLVTTFDSIAEAPIAQGGSGSVSLMCMVTGERRSRPQPVCRAAWAALGLRQQHRDAARAGAVREQRCSAAALPARCGVARALRRRCWRALACGAGAAASDQWAASPLPWHTPYSMVYTHPFHATQTRPRLACVDACTASSVIIGSRI